MARRDSDLIAFVKVFSRLPSWLCLGLALGAWFGLEAIVKYCSAPPGACAPLEGLTRRILATPCLVMQYLLPLLFVIAAILGAGNRLKRRRRLAVATASPGAALEAMSWRQFELLLSDAFRRQGFEVSESGGSQPDGGVDLRLRREGQVHLVQAKHWKARKVGVKVVREVYGVMTAEGAAGCLVVTSGGFTSEARVFARGKPLTLVDGDALGELLRGASLPVLEEQTPRCPRCGAGMVQREARKGSRAGQSFWGCSTYPRCRGIVDLPSVGIVTTGARRHPARGIPAGLDERPPALRPNPEAE